MARLGLYLDLDVNASLYSDLEGGHFNGLFFGYLYSFFHLY
jgi:hypothetical protein